MIGYEFLPQAEEEMNETASFYEGESEGLGVDFLDSVERSIESTLTYPLSGAEISKNIRRRIVRRFPYGVLYAIDKDQIVIVAIAHLKRRPGYWKSRIGTKG